MTKSVLSKVRSSIFSACLAAVMSLSCAIQKAPVTKQAAETPEQRDARMEWWRDARFGMFIHWGLYAIPAGEWKGNTSHAEWIRHTAKIPIGEYDKFVGQFNPVDFDADQWVRMAKRAGMNYIVITSKHHDGFCLWDSKRTDYDVASTPFRRDILKELTAACKKHGVRMCFYHSIMDWHHPDYLPRRDWEAKDRPAEGADFSRYITHMKSQLKELVDRYDPGVLWFDGEWENTWTHEMGKDLYQYVRGLKSDIIINNRVDKGRRGMQGLTEEGEFCGDFGTPEQEIPDRGLPGVDWESCMTMNNHWGWNKNDKNFKPTEDLIRKLIDIASKGGNFLLNIGPKADGTFPQESIERLEQIGQWMDVYAESIYGTQASPIKTPAWGRCTQKQLPDGNTRIYLHVFDWPKDGRLVVSGLANEPIKAQMLGGSSTLKAEGRGRFISVSLPAETPNKIASVIALDIKGKPQVVKINPYEDETPEQRAARMKWWHEARFGMFIHWGVYSVPAGTYNGQRIEGIGEWIMNRGKIPVAEYKKFAGQFNPVKYDPDQWVQLAKEAGMKYIVITSKHHDGFALFDSKVTDWDVVDATPYGKDLLKPLAEACQKHGIKLGFYYSQAQDWCHPGGSAARGGHWDKAQDGDMDEYIRNIAMPQVREILSNYGKLSVLWWDTPVGMTRERAQMLLPLIELQPGIITNNRLGGGYSGDFGTPEQRIPAEGTPGQDWETCMTMNGTWGYKSYDDNWKTTETLIRNLVDIASKGGNYLLNVGPTSLGEIPQPSVERLKDIGKWMAVNGESIYATTASPIGRPTWGRCTKKLRDDGATLYLHVFDWPKDGRLVVPGLRNKVSKAHILATKQFLTATPCDDGVMVDLPAEAIDSVDTVVALEVEGKLNVDKPLPAQADDGSLMLPAPLAEIHNPGSDGARVETIDGKPSIGFWTDARTWLSWRFRIDKPGQFDVMAEIACPEAGSKFQIKIGGQTLQAEAQNTGTYQNFKTYKIGQIKIDKPDKYDLEIRPVRDSWQPINLRVVTLKPIKKL